ncbi:MAG: NRDE family protein [Myxococcus sp.]|nr:NRDE family protein [Myxococcus sp.]
MCTLIVSFREHDQLPFFVAANRDEALTRPARGPFRWEGLPFVAPRDEQAGGTWLGVTTGGMFVGVTNRFMAPKHPERESRGVLVVEALRAPDARALHAQLATLSPTRFNAFHLLYVDATHAFVTWSDGDVVRQQVLAPGLHVVTERSLGGDDRARTTLIDERWREVSPHGAAPTPEALQRLLGATRPDDPLGGVCVEAPEWNYGTRSSFVFFRAPQLRASRFFWAEGRPDRTPFVERRDLVAALAEAG